MAALAASDGTVERAERKLLELCARRWSVPWSNVEMALNTGPQLFTRLIQRRTPEAEVFLRNLVEMALVDGRIDRKERRMLEFAAGHLELTDSRSCCASGSARRGSPAAHTTTSRLGRVSGTWLVSSVWQKTRYARVSGRVRTTATAVSPATPESTARMSQLRK